MNGIQTEPESCHWLSYLKASCSKEDQLKKRICLNWRIIPGVVTLVATVVAVVCSFLWNCPYLCIPFVPGFFASIYLIYLSWSFRDLKTFSKSNKELQASLETLQGNNEELRGRLETFQNENEKLKQSSEELSQLVGNLNNENMSLSESNNKLKITLEDLENLKTSLEQKTNQHVEQLSLLQQSLSSLENAAKEDHMDFSLSLEAFKEQVQLLHEARVGFEEAGSSIDEKMKEHVDILLNTANMLKVIFSQVNEWKNDKAVTERIHQQQLLSKNLIDLERQMSKVDGRLEEQSKQIDELGKIKLGFGEALNDLLLAISTLKGVKGDLEEQTKKVMQAAGNFLNYDIRLTN